MLWRLISSTLRKWYYIFIGNIVLIFVLVHSLWNYDVCNDHEYGDHWNGENFSIYSVKKAKEDYLEHDDGNSKLSKKHLYDGGRVLEAVLVRYSQN